MSGSLRRGTLGTTATGKSRAAPCGLSGGAKKGAIRGATGYCIIGTPNCCSLPLMCNGTVGGSTAGTSTCASAIAKAGVLGPFVGRTKGKVASPCVDNGKYAPTGTRLI